MRVETFEFTDVNVLVNHLLSYESHWMFRGHLSDTWILESSLERMLKPIGWSSELANLCESFSMFKFRSNAHHYLDHIQLPSTKLGWLSLMQHHGVPTRLLDFTTSPFIALFFAFDGLDPNQIDKCAIWAIDFRTLTKAALKNLRERNQEFDLSYNDVQMQQDEIFERIIDKNSYDVLWTTEPGVFNIRLERQKGTFLLSGNIGKKITDLIPTFLSSQTINKIIIPANLSSAVFKVMEKMGISNSHLFSDIDGLGRDIKNEILHQVTYKAQKNNPEAPS